jgi:IS30 family transposase
LTIHFVKTISSDNGSEFAYFKVIESFFDINWYFCDRYKSCQRACNERINRDVRILFPKGTDFTHISDDVITNKCKWINTIRRARLDKASQDEVIKLLTS